MSIETILREIDPDLSDHDVEVLAPCIAHLLAEARDEARQSPVHYEPGEADEARIAAITALRDEVHVA